jgi:hypothetical protein
MILNVPDRITLFGILPTEGHYADIVTLRRAKEVLSLTEEEIKATKYHEEEVGKTRMAYYDIAIANSLEKDIPLDEWTTRTISGILSKMEKEGKIAERFVSLFEKFVIAYAE